MIAQTNLSKQESFDRKLLILRIMCATTLYAVMLFAIAAGIKLSLISLLAILFVGVFFTIYRPLIVPSKQFAVVYDRFGQFVSFKPPGPYILPPNHVVIVYVSNRISSIQGDTVVNIRGGFDVKIKWSAACFVNPPDIPSEKQEDIADMLRDIDMSNIVKSRINNSFKQNLSKYDMWRWGTPNTHTQLEDDMMKIVQKGLDWAGFRVFNIRVKELVLPDALKHQLQQEFMHDRRTQLLMREAVATEEVKIIHANGDALVKQLHDKVEHLKLVERATRLNDLTAGAFGRLQSHQIVEAMNTHGIPRRYYSFADELLITQEERPGETIIMEPSESDSPFQHRNRHSRLSA